MTSMLKRRREDSARFAPDMQNYIRRRNHPLMACLTLKVRVIASE